MQTVMKQMRNVKVLDTVLSDGMVCVVQSITESRQTGMVYLDVLVENADEIRAAADVECNEVPTPVSRPNFRRSFRWNISGPVNERLQGVPTREIEVRV